MNKKSQAAFEFIMTYGWALLMASIAITALIYFNVLDMSNMIPERHYFSEELKSEVFTIQKVDSLTYEKTLGTPTTTITNNGLYTQVKLTNKFGDNINITSITGNYDTIKGTPSLSCGIYEKQPAVDAIPPFEDNFEISSSGYIVSTGEQVEIYCLFENAQYQKKEKIFFEINALPESKVFPVKINGEILGTPN